MSVVINLSIPFSKRAHIFPVQLFIASITVETFLSVLSIYFYVSNPFELQLFWHYPACWGNVFEFLWLLLYGAPTSVCNGPPSWIPCLAKLVADTSASMPEYWDESFLCLEDAVLKDLPAVLSSFCFSNLPTMRFHLQVSWSSQNLLPWSLEPVLFFIISPQDAELCVRVITASTTADYPVARRFFPD